MPYVPLRATRLSAIIDAVSYPMCDGTVVVTTDDGPVTLYYLSDTGLGLSPLQRFSEQAPAQHGESDVGFRLLPRTVNLGFAINAPLTPDTRNLDTARDILIDRFRPRATPISFRYERANGTVRQMDGFVIGGLDFGSEDRIQGTWFQRFTMQIWVPDPTFYDPTEATWWIANTANPLPEGLVVPFPVPFYVRSGILDASDVFGNDGSWETYPLIQINGELIAPRIENVVTGDVLSFPNTTIADGDYYTVDLNNGIKTVRHSSGEDRTHELSEDSNLATWNLVPGNQSIRVTATRAGRQTEIVRLTWINRFVGI